MKFYERNRKRMYCAIGHLNFWRDRFRSRRRWYVISNCRLQSVGRTTWSSDAANRPFLSRDRNAVNDGIKVGSLIISSSWRFHKHFRTAQQQSNGTHLVLNIRVVRTSVLASILRAAFVLLLLLSIHDARSTSGLLPWIVKLHQTRDWFIRKLKR